MLNSFSSSCSPTIAVEYRPKVNHPQYKFEIFEKLINRFLRQAASADPNPSDQEGWVLAIVAVMAVAHPVMAGSFLASSFMASWDRRVVASRASMAIVLLGLSQLTGGLQGLPHSSFTPCTRTIIRHEPSEVYQDSKPKLHWKIPTKFNCWPVNRICVTTDRLPGSRRDGARPFLLSCLSYCRDKRPSPLSLSGDLSKFSESFLSTFRPPL